MKYRSGMTTVEFVESLIAEADISFPITKASWVMWLNAAEQMLYSEIIADKREVVIPWLGYEESGMRLMRFPKIDGEATVMEEDIVKVYARAGEIERELQRVSFIGEPIFSGMGRWAVKGDVLTADLPGRTISALRIIYNARPELKQAGNDAFGTEEIYLPPAFMPMLAAKLRGEAYKLANEDALSAKWLADYNAQLEDFKVWCASHAPVFGER